MVETNFVRPAEKVPDTGKHPDRSQLVAEVAHENTLHDFAIDHTDLGVLDKDQMGVIALVDAGQSLGLYLPATYTFFCRIHDQSSAEEGKGRIAAKECITAGAFPMALLFPQENSGILDTIKGLLGKNKGGTPPQKGV
jgi:hypothetical protein